MTITLNFIDQANENPFVDALLTESNVASSQVTSSGYLQQITNSTTNLLTYSGTVDKVQSSAATVQGQQGTIDLWTSGAAIDIRLLYQDSTNYVQVLAANGGTNAKRFDITKVVGGTSTGIGSLTGLADTYLVAGDIVKLDAQWSGANATFVLTLNGSTILTSTTQTSFALTTGKPGYFLQRNASGRGASIRSLVFTGDTSASNAARACGFNFSSSSSLSPRG